jgi:hypothetical protein
VGLERIVGVDARGLMMRVSVRMRSGVRRFVVSEGGRGLIYVLMDEADRGREGFPLGFGLWYTFE